MTDRYVVEARVHEADGRNWGIWDTQKEIFAAFGEDDVSRGIAKDSAEDLRLGVFSRKDFLWTEGYESLEEQAEEPDMVAHPPHYGGHPKGYKAIDVIEDAPYRLGTAMKYIWRVAFGEKFNPTEDLEKAIWYLQREVEKRKNG